MPTSIQGRRLLLAGVVFATAAAAAQAAVRIGVKDGRRVVYNDGKGATREALARADDWLASRVALPSLYDGVIQQAARESSIDPRLVKSVVLIESGFNAGAVSPKGARGLMQLMPDTAVRYGTRDLLDPTQNVSAGARHLAYLLGVYGGDLTKSLAAYNAGEAAVARFGGIPPYQETRLYVRKGLAAYYGQPVLSGGFGRSPGESWASPGRPVRLTRDRNNRPLITTELSARAPLKRS